MSSDVALQKRFDKLYFSTGIGDFVISFIEITDMLAISTIDTATVAGYSLSAPLFVFLLLNFYSFNMFAYVEYLKEKNTAVLYALRKLGFITQILCDLLVFMLAGLTIAFSGLSPEANRMVILCVVIRSVGALFFILSTINYVYLRTSGFETKASMLRIITAVTNIVLDILAVVLHYGVYGVVLATVISEILEFIMTKAILIKNNVKFEKDVSIKARDFIPVYWDSVKAQGGRNFQVWIASVIFSRLGDELYAIYGVMASFLNAMTYFPYITDVVAETVFAEFRDKYDDKVELFKKIKKAPIKITILYILGTFLLVPIFIKIATISNGLTLNIWLFFIADAFWAIMECYSSLYTGMLCVVDDLKYTAFLSWVNVAIVAVGALLVLPFRNPYAAYSLCWIPAYVFFFVKSDKRVCHLLKEGKNNEN